MQTFFIKDAEIHKRQISLRLHRSHCHRATLRTAILNENKTKPSPSPNILVSPH